MVHMKCGFSGHKVFSHVQYSVVAFHFIVLDIGHQPFNIQANEPFCTTSATIKGGWRWSEGRSIKFISVCIDIIWKNNFTGLSTDCDYNSSRSFIPSSNNSVYSATPHLKHEQELNFHISPFENKWKKEGQIKENEKKILANYIQEVETPRQLFTSHNIRDYASK